MSIKKHVAILVAALTMLLVGCSDGNSVSQPEKNTDFPSGNENSIITFSEYTPGKNLDVTISLPEGWTTEKRDETKEYQKYPLSDLDVAIDIYNEQGVNVGAIGYTTYTETEGAEDNPKAIYSGIAVPNLYNFNPIDIKDGGSYEVVAETAVGSNAVTQVYYSEEFSQDAGYGGTEWYNKGVLAYNRDIHVYVAADFDSTCVDDNILQSIATSIVIAES